MKFPYFMLSWNMDRAGKHPQPIIRAFLRAVLSEVWWKRQMQKLSRKTKIYDKFKVDKNAKGKYATMKISLRRNNDKTRST